MNMLANFAEWLHRKLSRRLSDEYLESRMTDTGKLIKAGFEAGDSIATYALNSAASDWAHRTDNEYDRIMIERLRNKQELARIHARIMKMCAEGWKDEVVNVTMHGCASAGAMQQIFTSQQEQYQQKLIAEQARVQGLYNPALLYAAASALAGY